MKPRSSELDLFTRFCIGGMLAILPDLCKIHAIHKCFRSLKRTTKRTPKPPKETLQ
jgi:hypothetical protein